MIVYDVAVPWKGIYCRDHHMEGDCEEVAFGKKWVEETAQNSRGRDSVEDMAVQ